MLKNNHLYLAALLLALPTLMGSIELSIDYSNSKPDASDYLPFYALEYIGNPNGNEKPFPEITLCSVGAMSITPGILEWGDKGAEISQSKPNKNYFNALVYMQEKATVIDIEIVPELMKFNKDIFTVTAGKKVMLEIDNLDGMQHNLLIVKPGMLEKVGAAADAMLRDPKASEKHYVPQIPEVLFATKMLGPNEVFTLNFTAPTQVGDYPFVCTFPGHWRMMSGIMRVLKP